MRTGLGLLAAVALWAVPAVHAANQAGGPAVIVKTAPAIEKHSHDTQATKTNNSGSAQPTAPQQTTPQQVSNPQQAEDADTAAESPHSGDETAAKPQTSAQATPQPTWSSAEIADAQARCAVILKRINAIAIPETPIKSGACGAPAPIQLISIGKKPEVTLSPPAIVTCELAEGLATWLATSLQPLSKKHFGAEIIKIENMSSYSCRNAYGRAGNKLSEHGRANALDIRGFTTASGKVAIVLDDWGTTQREIRERIAAEKALQEKALAAQRAQDEKVRAAAEASARANPNGQAAVAAAPAAATGGRLPAGPVIEGVPGATALRTLLKPARPVDPQLSIAEPTKLGGPTAAAAQIAVTLTVPGAGGTPGQAARREFLHAAHESACTIFGTTLGPEANAAHRNHFHVDMAPRKTTKICD